MDIRQLEVLVYVAKLNSFTKAAEELGFSQPTISLHIQNLEKELGVQLIDRRGKKSTLTPAGKILFDYAVEILELRKKALLAIKEFLGKIEGEFEIGASTVPGEYLLPNIISQFVKQYPDTRFSIRISDSENVISKVVSEEYEMGVVGCKVDDEKLEFIPFMKDEIVVVKHPELPDIKGLEDLKTAPLVFRERGSGTRRVFEKSLEEKGITRRDLNIVAELGSTTAVKEAVKNKLGYGVISKLAVEEELREGRFQKVELPGVKAERQLYIVRLVQKTLSPAIRLLIEFIANQKWKSEDRGKA